ncbi:PD40 domain-containing protein [Candidatus Sumerlaeota bacterium]|nr:PD40 domain-containing protein [Candidatus Sumerlaeota bacterium]
MKTNPHTNTSFLLLTFILTALLAGCLDVEEYLALPSPDGRKLLVPGLQYDSDTSQPIGEILLAAPIPGVEIDDSFSSPLWRHEPESDDDKQLDAPLRFIGEVELADGCGWLSDSRHVAFCRRTDGNEDIWLLDTAAEYEKGQVHRATSHLARDWNPVPEPGRMSLLFVSNRNGDADILRLRLDRLGRNDAVEPVVVAPQDQLAPTLSTDGRWLFYVSYEQVRPMGFVRELKTGRTVVVPGTLDAEGYPPQWIAWPAGSSEFYFAREAGDGWNLTGCNPLAATPQTQLRDVMELPDAPQRLAATDRADEFLFTGKSGKAWLLLINREKPAAQELKFEGLRVHDVIPFADGRRATLMAGACAGLARAPFEKIDQRVDMLAGLKAEVGDRSPLDSMKWVMELHAQGFEREARDFFDSWIDVCNEDVRRHFRMEYARWLVAAGEPDKALKSMDEWLVRLSMDEGDVYELGFDEALVYENQGAKAFRSLERLALRGQLKAEDRIRALQLLASVEFDVYKQFGAAERYYKQAEVLHRASQIKEPLKLDDRMRTLATENLDLIEAMSDYFEASKERRIRFENIQPPRRLAPERDFKMLLTAVRTAPDFAPALERLPLAAQSEKDREKAVKTLLSIESSSPTLILRMLLELDDVDAARDYLLKNTRSVVQNTEVQNELHKLLRQIITVQPWPADATDSERWELLWDEKTLEAISQYLPQSSQHLSVAVNLRRAMASGDTAQIDDAMRVASSYFLQAAQQKIDVTGGLILMACCTGQEHWERFRFKEAYTQFDSARQLLAQAYAIQTKDDAPLLDAAEYREQKIWLDAHAALMKQAPRMGKPYIKFMQITSPLRKARYAGKIDPDVAHQMAQYSLTALSATDDPQLQALCLLAAADAYDTLNHPRISAACCRRTLELKPTMPLRLMAHWRLLQNAEREGDTWLVRQHMASIREQIPGDRLLQALFAEDQP